MADEIEGINGRRKKDLSEFVWKPWQPPPGFQPPAVQNQEDPAIKPVSSPTGRLQADRNGTGPLAASALDRVATGNLNLEEVKVPDELMHEVSGAGDAAPAQGAAGTKGVDTARAIGELGVVATLSQVALAFSKTPFSPGDMAASLGSFASHLKQVGDQLGKIPGVGPALEVFGGVGGVVSGAIGFKEELASIKKDGLGLQNGLGVASNAAKFMGGVAMALAPLCQPLAPVGVSLTLAGAALEMGKLAVSKRPELEAAAKKVGEAAGQAAKIIGNNGSAAVAVEGLNKIISNNGSAAVQTDVNRSFAWMTG